MTVSADTKVCDYDTEAGNEFAALIAEFFSIPYSEAQHRIDEEFLNPGGLVARAWRSENPQTPEEISQFYKSTDSYIYDLAADHCHVRRKPVREAIIERVELRGPSQRVLLYGDGIGSDSIALAKRGHSVTYFDLPGLTSAFARFRFEKEAEQDRITPLERESDIPLEGFDAVVCIEVLEHVPDPLAVMTTLHRALKTGGIALITESFESIGEEFPSHLPGNFQYAGKTHRMMEGLGFANTYYNLAPLNRPMEFTKIETNLSGKYLRFKTRLGRAIRSRRNRFNGLSA